MWNVLKRSASAPRRRRYIPTVAGLEGRQLLSAVTTTILQGVDSQLTLSGPILQGGTGLVITGNSATCAGTSASFVTSVGASYSISLAGALSPVGPAPAPDGPAPSPPGDPAPAGPAGDPTPVGGGPILEEVDWGLPNSYTSASSYTPTYASFVPEQPYLATSGANIVTSKSDFFGAQGGGTNLQVVAKFSDGTVDDYKLFINVKLPTGTLTVNLPPGDGGDPTKLDAFHLGAFEVTSGPGGTTSYTPVPWGNAGFAASTKQDATTYWFGAKSPGGASSTDNNVKFFYSAYNNTPLAGTFMIVNYVQSSISYESQTATGLGTFLESDFSYKTPGFGTSNAQWGNDILQNGPALPAVPGLAVREVNPYSQVGPVTGPGAGLSYYDNPSVGTLIQGDTNTYITSVQMQSVFQSILVWTPQGGMPIGIQTQDWGMYANYQNTTPQANLSFANVYADPDAWIGSTTVVGPFLAPGNSFILPNTTVNAADDARSVNQSFSL